MSANSGLRPALLLVLLALPVPAAAAAVSSHALNVVLDPASHGLRGAARLVVAAPPGASSVELWLGADYVLDTAASGGHTLERGTPRPARRDGSPASWNVWTLTPGAPAAGEFVLDLEWSGTVRPATGHLDAAGALLRAASGWYPTGDQPTSTFEVTVTVPAPWRVLAPGRRVSATEPAGGWQSEHYESVHPLEGFDLVAAPWTVSEVAAADTRVVVFTLGDAPPQVAPATLRAATVLLDRYTREFGPHAWPQFAIAEDARAAGLAGPSFVVFKPAELRAPATLGAPLAHAIVHEWWGNGVYVDRAKGDWSEGLASYFAEHAFARDDAPGGDVDYRRSVLRAYAEFAARPGRDRPLEQCRERHAPAERALVAGKGSMVFHMLRRELGDDTFREGLRSFYAAARYRPSAWSDLADVFARLRRQSLDWFFEQWVQRPGAPEVSLVPGSIALKQSGDELLVDASIEATPGWTLRVPLELQGVSDAGQRVRRGGVGVTGAAGAQHAVEHVRLRGPRMLRPQLTLDPDVDVFRTLDPREVPPTLARIAGVPIELVILGTGRGGTPDPAARNVAEQLRQGKGMLRTDREVDEATLAAAERVVIVGRPAPESVAGKALLAALPAATALGDAALRVAGTESAEPDATLCLVLPHGAGHGRALAVLDALHPGSLLALVRRLPDYDAYSYLLFAGNSPLVTEVAAAPWSPVLPLEVK